MKAVAVVSVLMAIALLTGSAVHAVTIDSSWGWDASYPASNTIDGVYGTANRGKANATGWAIYDLGVATPISKVRMCAPTLGGTAPQNVNPTSSSITFSNDKVNWSNLPTTWSCPALESANRIDMSEIAIAQTACYRYVKWLTIPGGQVAVVSGFRICKVCVIEQVQNPETSTLAGYTVISDLIGNPERTSLEFV